jgi:6-pyruvoyl-tetrahydropterin synthase related domain
MTIGIFQRVAWLVAVAGVATLAVSRAFSCSHVFYLRDLAGYFWPHHLWLRRTVWSGFLPLWAPGAGLGYATIADPNLQMLFPLTIGFRLVLPDVPGFNLMVALPVPLGALGAFVFLRRRFTGAAAATGALVFALSGPFLSTLAAPNLSSSAALVPWELWTLDRFVEDSSIRRGVALAVAIALIALAGEPLSLAAAGIVSVAYAAAMFRKAGDAHHPLRAATAVAGWQLVGGLLAAGQILPLFDAASRSPRATGAVVDGWSVHPLALVEAVAPGLFGSPVDAVSAWSPWLLPLNGGHEPFLGSLYVGTGALALALLGGLESARRRWIVFWSVTLAVMLVLTLGYFTPVYPSLRSTVPFLSSVRYPAKFAVFAAVALGCLVAAGIEALPSHRRDVARARGIVPLGVAGAVAVVALLAWVMVPVSPGVMTPILEGLAARSGLPDPRAGAEYLTHSIGNSAPRLFLSAAGTAFLLWAARRRERTARITKTVLLASIVVDLLVTNESLNPTLPVSWVGEPQWVAVARAHPGDRVYSGQATILPLSDPEVLQSVAVNADTPAPAVTALLSTTLSTFPMAWGVRSALTPDLTRLRPSGYSALLERFAAGDQDARQRFLRRIGTRYHLALKPPQGGRPLLALAEPLGSVMLYEDPQPGPHAFVVASSKGVPRLQTRIEALLAEDFAPYKEVLLAGPPPPPSGMPGEPVTTTSATIIAEWPTGMRVAAAVPAGGGFLVVVDSYDPNWVVDVDGVGASLLEADGLFRAVHLMAGRHDVVFRYRSRPLLIGVLVSLVIGLVCIVGCVLSRPAPPTDPL